MTENTKKPEKKAVFLDTEVFDHLNHDYAHRDFRTLTSLAEDGQVNVILTTVTQKEVLAHIERRLTEAHRELKNVVTRHHILRISARERLADLQSDEAISKMLDERVRAFSNFCRENLATILDIAGVNPENIFEDYFNRRPPFSVERKRTEFPDAFAAGALHQWCEREDRTLHVVSADPDWKAICEGDKRLIYKPSLAAFLELFPDAALVAGLKTGLRSRWDEVDGQVGEIFGDLSFYLEDAEGEVEQVEVIGTNEASLFVIEAEKGEVRFEAECEVEFEARVRYEHPLLYSYYGDERDMYPDKETGRVTKCVMVTAEITAAYDAEDPEELSNIWVSVFAPRKEIGVSIKRLLYEDEY